MRISGCVVIGVVVLAGCSPSTNPPPPTPVVETAAGPPTEEKPQTLDELLLFHPAKHPAGDWRPKGLSFADVWLTAADGTRLHAWYCPCPRPRAVVLYAHGNAGHLADCADLLRYLQHHLRVTTLAFDYRGYGRSDGDPTVDGILQDARAARATLAQQAGVREADVVLMGRSLGGAVVVQLAAEAPARGLVVESSFASFRDAAAHHSPNLAWLAPKQKLNSVERIRLHKGPLLQSHGDRDATIPFEQGRKMFAAATGPKRWVTIPGGDHNDPQTEAYYRELGRFLDDLPK